MANNYLQFSEVLDALSEEEQHWLERQLETVYVFGDRQYTDRDLPEHLAGANADWSGCRFLSTPASDEPCDDCGFQFAFGDDPEFGRHVWLYADDSGEPLQVANLVQEFLRRFRLGQFWSLTYATTCSKPRVGEFSGGGIFVTAEAIDVFDAYDLVQQRRVAFENRAAAHNIPQGNPA